MTTYYNEDVTKLAKIAERLQAGGFEVTVREISLLDQFTLGNSYLTTNARYHEVTLARREPSDLDFVPGRAS